MNKVFNYRGYTGSVEYSEEDKIYHGSIQYIKDCVSYEGKDIKELEADFKSSVDDYLSMCEDIDKLPDVPLNKKITSEIMPYNKEFSEKLDAFFCSAIGVTLMKEVDSEDVIGFVLATRQQMDDALRSYNIKPKPHEIEDKYIPEILYQFDEYINYENPTDGIIKSAVLYASGMEPVRKSAITIWNE